MVGERKTQPASMWNVFSELISLRIKALFRGWTKIAAANGPRD